MKSRFPATGAVRVAHGSPGAPEPVAPGATPRPAPLRPQRLLHESAQDARRHQAPSGLGLDSAAVRARMVRRLQAQVTAAPAVWEAMGKVPRHLFVDPALAPQAYEDTSLPIGHGQTISKPSVVARMIALLCDTEAARQRGHLGRVLEIGTGCGYQAAVLSLLARQVVSVERVAGLYEKAKQHLKTWGQAEGVRLVHADGTQGVAAGGPFDAIISAAGGDELPAAWMAQLAPGGRIVAPVGGAGGTQALCVLDRHGAHWRRSVHEDVHFVPLKSGLD